MFKGSMVALVTPMHTDGSLDLKSFCKLIDWHIESGTSAIIVAGTTGEASTLTDEEISTLLSLAIKQADGKLPIIAGTGSNCTQKTLKASLKAQSLGVDGCLIVTPYYNKPTQQGLFEHYKLIAEALSIPVILYNVPGRTACDILPATVAKLSSIKNIVGIKEATGNIERAVEIINTAAKDFEIYSGDDLTGLDLILSGGHGVISVTTNIAPVEMHAMCQAAFDGNIDLAKQINEKLTPLHKKLFLEANPIPTKWALHEMGMIPAGIRLPLTPFDAKFHNELKNAIQQADVLKHLPIPAVSN